MAVPTRRFPTAAPLAQRNDPFRELDEFHRQMEQLLENAWAGATPGEGGDVWTPLVDIEETDDAWVIEAELPGVDRDDVNIELRDSELTITGEIKERERKGILRRRTRRVGRFELRVTLPGEADPDNIEASLKDGVLSVRVPKPEPARPRRIELKSD
jgi:HSP20 family protein